MSVGSHLIHHSSLHESALLYRQAKNIAMDAANDKAEKNQKESEKTSVRDKIKSGQEKVAKQPEVKNPGKVKTEPAL